MENKKLDLVDAGILVIVALSVTGLVWTNPAPAVADTLTSIIWAGMVGLGFKKATH